ncbi:hypothetical protein HOY82DRAFT_669629 [Tuber indicum]|nr:hypothetical protein HOY82DRAFT_669629 [Tuber indicum]
MRFNLVGLLVLYVCFDKIGAFATQWSNSAMVGVCPSYSVQKAIPPGGALEARASVDCGSCVPGHKCCEPKDAAPFCIPEDACCCGRTWCSAGFQCCEYGGGNGGCCPIGWKCAVWGRGCCKDGEQCLGPFRCHDFGSTACAIGEADSFLCCSAAYPYCRWDPSFGYGCLDSEGIQSVIRSRSESTNASSTPSTIESGSQTTATATPTSSSGNEVVTSVPNAPERTRKETHTPPATSLTTAPSGAFSTTTSTNMTTSSGTKRFSGTKGSTTATTGVGTTVGATGTASPSDTSTAIGAGFADLSKGLGWGAIFVWLARLLIA